MADNEIKLIPSTVRSGHTGKHFNVSKHAISMLI
jgi:hypothetical protein